MPDRNARFALTLIDALARLGVRHACVTPGSRNTPLSLALADSPITDWSHHDERSSAFFALGIAKTTGVAVLVVTTSGTAAAELHPALVEARYARVPLIALTADRPRELRDTGAPQTIDQHDLFGTSVKWSGDMEVPTDAATAVEMAVRMWSEAMSAPRGAVHLNLGFREPLVPPRAVSPDATEVPEVTFGRYEAAREVVTATATALSGLRGVIMAGPTDEPGVPVAAARFATATGWPILADPLSGVRTGPHDRTHVVAASDALAWAGFLDASRTEAVVRFGAIPTSKAMWEWLGAHPEVPQVFIESVGRRDPTASASVVLRSDVAPTLDLLAESVGATTPEWLDRWLDADREASMAMAAVIDGAPFPNEPLIARIVAGSVPSGSVLWVASSMPVRDLDAVMPSTDREIRVLANRGTNGIDGFVSSALGSAAVSGQPTVALAGDLSVLHDIGALATAKRLGIGLTLVVVNNDGGGIFHLLPQVALPQFERHWGTPHGLDLTAIAAGFGVDAERVDRADHLAMVVASPPTRPRLIELVTDRAENATLHRRIRAEVARAIAEGTAHGPPE